LFSNTKVGHFFELTKPAAKMVIFM